MALFYAFILEPRLPGGAWLKGLIYAAAVWILNAAFVLPATGEGFAGSVHLSLGGHDLVRRRPHAVLPDPRL